TPMVARATSQRLMNQSTASEIPTPIAAAPSIHRPRRSRWATGPSITALVISGIATVAPRLTIATATIAVHRARYGARYGSSRHRSELARRRAGAGAIAGVGARGA